jgi:hypothetical protein
LAFGSSVCWSNWLQELQRVQLMPQITECNTMPELEAARIAARPVDATLRGKRVVAPAGGFLAFPAAGVLGHFFLGLALPALPGGEELHRGLGLPGTAGRDCAHHW